LLLSVSLKPAVSLQNAQIIDPNEQAMLSPPLSLGICQPANSKENPQQSKKLRPC